MNDQDPAFLPLDEAYEAYCKGKVSEAKMRFAFRLLARLIISLEDKPMKIL